jgi:hypothetical protein
MTPNALASEPGRPSDETGAAVIDEMIGWINANRAEAAACVRLNPQRSQLLLDRAQEIEAQLLDFMAGGR